MATLLAKGELFEPRVGRRVLPRPTATYDGRFVRTDLAPLPMRGIVFGVLHSVPLWALIGFAIYLLV